MDAKEAREVFLSRNPILWKDLKTQKEYEFPRIEALKYRFVKGVDKPILQLEVLDHGCVLTINPMQARKKG